MAIILDIGDSLRTLLLKKISELPDESAIVFDSPVDIEANSNTKLSIFLYQVVENSFLKNIRPEYVGRSEMHYPPLLIDLYYLFTPYAKNRETELIIIEKLLQVFYDNPVLKKGMLKESLKGSGNDEIRIVPNNVTFEEINKLWERFPNKAFKLSVSCILTPVRIPSEKPLAVIKRVMEKEIDIHEIGVA
jgi:hypothetical protein